MSEASLCPQILQSGDTDVLGFIKKVSQRKFKLEEAKQAKEVFMVGSSTVVSCAPAYDLSPPVIPTPLM